MAARTFQTRRDENNIRVAASKNYYGKHDIKPRAALGSLSSNLVQREALHRGVKKSVVPAALKPSVVVKPSLPLQQDAGFRASSRGLRIPTPEDVDVEEVGMVTEQLSRKLYIEDIDTVDSDNPQLCAEYVKGIYDYLMKLEKKFHTRPTYMEFQAHINSKMRAILIDWLIQVHQRFTLLQETLFLTVSIIDRFLSVSLNKGWFILGLHFREVEVEHVEKKKLQLVGVTAMLIASKYEEMYAPEVRDFVFITDDTYTSEDIRRMETQMLVALDYSFGNPLCLHFLRRYSRAGGATPEIHTTGKFLLELCLTEYSMLEFTPSTQAAAALYVSKLVCKAPGWTPMLEHYSTYNEKAILPCASNMAKLVLDMSRSKQKAVQTKYASSKFMRVSKAERFYSCDELRSLEKICQCHN